jgi:hypothetical protein
VAADESSAEILGVVATAEGMGYAATVTTEEGVVEGAAVAVPADETSEEAAEDAAAKADDEEHDSGKEDKPA